MELAKLYVGDLTQEFDSAGQAPAQYALAKTGPEHHAGDTLFKMARFCNAFSGGTFDDDEGAATPVFTDETGDPVRIDTSVWEGVGNARNHAVGHVPTGPGEARLSEALYDELKDACLALLNDPVFSKMPPSSRAGPAEAIGRIEEIHRRDLVAVDKADIANLERRIQNDQQHTQVSFQAVQAEVADVKSTLTQQVEQMKAKLEAQHKAQLQQIRGNLDVMREQKHDVAHLLQSQHDLQVEHGRNTAKLTDITLDMASADTRRTAQLLDDLCSNSDRQIEQIKDMAQGSVELWTRLQSAQTELASKIRVQHLETRQHVSDEHADTRVDTRRAMQERQERQQREKIQIERIDDDERLAKAHVGADFSQRRRAVYAQDLQREHLTKDMVLALPSHPNASGVERLFARSFDSGVGTSGTDSGGGSGSGSGSEAAVEVLTIKTYMSPKLAENAAWQDVVWQEQASINAIFGDLLQHSTSHRGDRRGLKIEQKTVDGNLVCAATLDSRFEFDAGDQNHLGEIDNYIQALREFLVVHGVSDHIIFWTWKKGSVILILSMASDAVQLLYSEHQRTAAADRTLALPGFEEEGNGALSMRCMTPVFSVAGQGDQAVQIEAMVRSANEAIVDMDMATNALGGLSVVLPATPPGPSNAANAPPGPSTAKQPQSLITMLMPVTESSVHRIQKQHVSRMVEEKLNPFRDPFSLAELKVTEQCVTLRMRTGANLPSIRASDTNAHEGRSGELRVISEYADVESLILKPKHNVIILGAPASGKSCLMKKLAILTAANHSPEYVPLFVELVRLAAFSRNKVHDVDQGSAADISGFLELLTRYFENVIFKEDLGARNPIAQVIRRLLGAGDRAATGIGPRSQDSQEVVFLFDGLDETGERRDSFATSINRLAGAGTRVVISSRDIGQRKLDALFDGFGFAELQPLTKDMQAEVIGKRVPEPGLQETIRNKTREPQLSELASSPLLLSMMIHVFGRDSSSDAAPRTRNDLYSYGVDSMLAQRSRNKHLDLDATAPTTDLDLDEERHAVTLLLAPDGNSTSASVMDFLTELARRVHLTKSRDFTSIKPGLGSTVEGRTLQHMLTPIRGDPNADTWGRMRSSPPPRPPCRHRHRRLAVFRLLTQAGLGFDWR